MNTTPSLNQVIGLILHSPIWGMWNSRYLQRMREIVFATMFRALKRLLWSDSKAVQETDEEAIERVKAEFAELEADLERLKAQEETEKQPLISISIEGTNPESRPEAYRNHVEYVLSHKNLYSSVPEQYLENWERRAELVVLPPDEWRLVRTKKELLEVDANWKFIFAAKSETDWQLYLYSIKGHPDLIKVGIAKDVLKRKEKYYGRCLKKWVMPRREAILVEELFKHATYGLHSTTEPKCNVGNMQRETVHQEINELWSQYEECSGFTEIRRMDKETAIGTIDQIHADVKWNLPMDELLLKYAIKTFNSMDRNAFREVIEVPSLMWQLRPHDSQNASAFDHVDDPEIRASCIEADQEDEAEILSKCWRSQDWS